MSSSLSPEDLQRLDTLFERVADLPSAEHEAFLTRECGSNDALRAELERLLAGLAGEDVFARLLPGAPLPAGTRIGPYTLQERIGQGGMGEVYAAEQLEPIRRRVALKIIKPGMDSAEVVARFHAERQALARMAHPHVAQVFDASATEDGRPYFVMEYVAGEALAEYCDRRKLSTRARLELFLDVCEGVQHAHQKGIIHRDLKPSNLLVAEHEGRAFVKVIDFGVARATTGRLADRTLHTMLGQIVGTLDYMSPEQADPTGTDIDTRSDIYSLGVVLYQLVCGLLPFAHEPSVDTPFSEIMRTIRETDPPTPSMRLRRSTDTAAGIAVLRGTTEHALVRQLSGDLDWICLKALEKDPARRYASASELAEDLRRHLVHEPVLAGRPGALYRARKFVRRNRVGVTAGVLVSAGILAGGFGIAAGKIESRAQQPQVDNDHARQLLRRADELWPPGPERIGEMEEWIAEAQDLGRRRAGYQADLEQLRAAAEPRTAAQIEKDRAACPLAGELARVTACLTVERGEGNSSPTDETRPKLEQRIRDLEAEEAQLKRSLAEWRTWQFASPAQQSRHDVLALLLDELRILGDATSGLLCSDAIVPEYGWSMPMRQEFSRSLEERTISGPEARELWDEAIAAIAASPKYQGLQLERQMGLLPIGEDPHSGLWEFAHLQSGSPPRRGPDGHVLRTELGELPLGEGTGLVFTLIPGGTFRMGQPQKDHEVTLSPYFLSKYEMTQGQWKRLTGTNPSDYGPDNRWEAKWLESGAWPSLMHPVEQVSWWDCMKWLPRAGLMLPSEAQWECAAKAGKNLRFWWSNQFAGAEDKVNLLDEYAVECNFNGLQIIQLGYEHYDGSAVHNAVGTYEPNPFGLFNIHGNVFEWCLDGYDELTPDLIHSDNGLDPWAEYEGTGTRRHRGGSFRLGWGGAGSWDMQYDPPDQRGHALGVRPARAVSSK